MKKSKLNFNFFMVLLLLLLIAVFMISKNFIYDFIIALIITHIFMPVYKKLQQRISNGVASFGVVIIIIFIVVIPLFFLSIMAIQQGTIAFSNMQKIYPDFLNNLKNININGFLDRHIGSFTSNIDLNSKISDIFGFLFSQGIKLFKNTFFNFTYLFVHIFFILFFLYYLLKDHDKIKDNVFFLIPLTVDKKKDFFNEFFKVTDAIIKGTFLIGIIEGSFGILLFTLVGIDSAILWGFFMVILSMIPLVGTNAILVPAAIMFFIKGNIFKGLLLLVIGSGGILISQNILKPRLVGKSGGMHPAIVLISSIGGIAWLGIMGFVLGPLIVSLFILSIKLLTKESIE